MDVNPYKPPNAEPSEPIAGMWNAGRLSLVLAVVASAALIVAAAHVRVDRTRRRPEVTSVGPLAGYIAEVTYGALGLSLVAGGIALWVATEKRHGTFAAVLALCVIAVNFYVTLIANVAIYED